jgi:hypothetical protein
LIKKRYLFILILVCLFTISAVSAADNTTNDIASIDETTDEFTNVEDNLVILKEKNNIETFTDLNAKINNNTKSNIYLNNDYYYDVSSDLDFKDGITTNRDITIYGNGFTISGENTANKGGAMYNSIAAHSIFKGSSEGDNTYDTDMPKAILTISNSTSTYNYGDKFIVNFTTVNGIPISDANITIRIYKNNTFIDSYYFLSGDGWIINLYPGDYNAVLSVENQAYIVEPVNVAFKINKIDTTLTVHDVVVASGSPAEVSVTLKDCYGNPVKGVKVKIVVGDSVLTTTTDIHGQVNWIILDLAPGEYRISARSSGVDSRYAESKAYGKAIVYTGRIDTTLTVPDIIVIGNSSDDVVATLKDCYGNPVKGVKVKIVVGDLSIINKTDANGQVSLDISRLAPGEYKISARSSGVSGTYNEAKATAKAIVSAEKLDTTLTVPDIIIIGKNVVVATLKDCYGNLISGVPVKIVIGNLTKTVNTDANGRVSLDISSLAPGEYDISARSSGVNDIYKEAKVTSKTIISKDKLDTTLTIHDVVVASGSPAEVSATLKDCYGNPVKGVKVKIVVGDSVLTIATNIHGQVNWIILDLAPGEYRISARSSGADSRYAESKAYGKAIVYTERIDTTLTVPDIIVIGNSSDVVVATLTDSDGNAVSDIKVKVVLGDLSIINKTDANGQVSLDISRLAPGEYKISARSSGVSGTYKEAKVTSKTIISEGKLDTILTVPDIIIIGKNVVVATLKDCYGNPVGDVPVKIVIGNLTKTVNTDANGRVSLDISSLAPGEYDISAKSSGVNDIYKEAKVTSKTIISKDKLDTTLTIHDVVAVSGSPAEVSATLKDCYGNPIKGVKVKIVVGDSAITITTDIHGQANWIILDLAPGEYNISARSSGTNDIYKEAKAKAKAIVYANES